MRSLTLSAPAKINLTLDILRRRPDGYHDLRMVMQSVSLSDTVRVTTGCGDGITVRCDDPALPTDSRNLAYRAADAFFRHTGLNNSGVTIVLEKHIPIQAGLAGGSTNAAAVLRALRALLAPSMPEAELEKIGATVGSDVPYCVHGGTALAEGRGERLTTLPALPDCTIVLSKPDFGLSTPALFSRVRVECLTQRPDTGGMVHALSAGDLSAVVSMVGNVFEEVLLPPERQAIDNIRNQLLSHGALTAAMSGSGPTVFGIFDSAEKARSAAESLPHAFVTVPV